MAITITRTVEGADDLRRAARSTQDVAQARRLLAIALVLDGQSRTDAATAAGMDWQSLRDWVHRFNAEGPAGLVDKRRSGRPSRMTAEQLQVLDAVVEAGPDIETDGVVKWRRVDLQRVIEEKYGVVLCERSVGRILHDRGFRHVSFRPQHPKSDPGAQALLKKLRRAGEEPASGRSSREGHRDLVPGRGPCRPERNTDLRVGAMRHASARRTGHAL